MRMMTIPHATTVLGVRHQGKVTLGNTIVNHQARKVRRLYHDRVLAGFAGTAADGFALFSRFESKLEEHRGNLERAAVELARDWRTDRALRRLAAMMLVADPRRAGPPSPRRGAGPGVGLLGGGAPRGRCTSCPAPAI